MKKKIIRILAFIYGVFAFISVISTMFQLLKEYNFLNEVTGFIVIILNVFALPLFLEGIKKEED